MDDIIRVYDSNMKKIAYLQNAYNIGYNLPLNELWTAKFTLPADDSKNKYCEPFNYVEIFDGGERIELFRIMPSLLTRNEQGDIVYTCEHVLATLLDDVLFQYHQIGGVSSGTIEVLRYVLDRQLTPRWQLGSCEFDRKFEYKWENDNLLAALFSIPKTFDEAYRWEFDTTATPWRLYLRKPPTKFNADIVYRKNMLEIKKEVDPSTIVTRLYCLGYGEGDNQLTIASANGSIPYIEANVSTYGIKASILTDRRYESAETLLAYGKTLLKSLCVPYKSYSVSAADLHRLDAKKYQRFFPGDIVRVIDKEDGIIEDLPIAKVSKSDVTGDLGSIKVEISSTTRDIASSITDLQDRTRINEVYAQGATNQMIVPFNDNADPEHPAVMKIYIPDTMVRINKCILNFQLEAFRAYSKAVGGGGASTESTSSGGGSTPTSSEGGAVVNTSGGGHWFWENGYTSGFNATYDAGEHNHGIRNGTGLKTADGNTVYFYESGDHGHTISGNHDHKVEIPSHTHQTEIPSHKHTVAFADHTHDLEFGIYQGSTANSVTIKVDGNQLPAVEEGQDVNIVPYMSVDSSGKINRNTWHTIEIIPDRMTRVTANIFLQIFTQSRGGGDY
nr:phage tail protein [uncultured Aminipila sp.]